MIGTEEYFDSTKIKTINYVAGISLLLIGIVLVMLDLYITFILGGRGLLLRTRYVFVREYHILFAGGLSMMSGSVSFLKYNFKLHSDDNNLRKKWTGTVSYIGIKRYPFRKYHRIDITDSQGIDKLFITADKLDLPYGCHVYIMHGEKSKFVYKIKVVSEF